MFQMCSLTLTQFLSVLFLVYCRLNFIFTSNQQYILIHHFLFLVFLVYDHHIKKNFMRFIFDFKCDSVCVLLVVRNFFELHMSVM